MITVSTGKPDSSFEKVVRRCVRQKLVPRIMARDATVFSTKRNLQRLIGNRLGWVDVASSMKRKIPAIEKFGKDVLRDRINYVVVIGMGGSSLCPDLLGKMYGHHRSLHGFRIIDSTDPAAVNSVLRSVDLRRAFFIVSSKSGGTIETRSHEAFFLQVLRDSGIKDVGRHFAAVTDRNSPLHQFARHHRYRRVFVNPSDIGGRYSALSYFGLVPAFFAGVDLRAMLDDAVGMERMLRDRADESNPALVLGAWIASKALAGRDKLTFLTSRRAAPLVPWIEQLVAESTGKKGRGVIPVEGEEPCAPGEYGRDRCFVVLRMGRERLSRLDGVVAELKSRKVPAATVRIDSVDSLGAQFLLWETVTAVVGKILGVNPFDEPNVTESKENTKRILDTSQVESLWKDARPFARSGNIQLLSAVPSRRLVKSESPGRCLAGFLKGTRPPQYVAILNYVASSPALETALKDLRRIIRKKTGTAVLRGYGPRYLHSIGQLYKGGPPSGRFILFVRSKYGRALIPGQPFDFADLIAAQALGEAQALQRRGLPILVLAVKGSPAAAIKQITGALERSR